MGKILDTYVHKKKQTTKNERCYSLTGKFLNKILETIGAIY